VFRDWSKSRILFLALGIVLCAVAGVLLFTSL
jgi:hypothetical protein